MTRGWIPAAVAVMLLAAGCASKKAQAPPPPAPAPPPAKQSVFVLLPDPDGKTGGITVTNPAGTQELTQPNQAVRVAGATAPPSAPAPLDQAEIKRLFGSALEVLPAAEARFILYFDEGRDALNAASEAQIPAILAAIRERRSTAVGITGHTDTTGNHDSNYQLGLRRAQSVSKRLLAEGVADSSIFVTSHGDTDLLVKTLAGVAEQRNRRVEVIVR